MSEASQKRARGADAIDLTTEDVSPREKKMRESINGVAAELRCPITQELPFDPVMAEDGKIYERKAILEWFSKKDRPTSPSTGAVIGKKLLPAVQTKNTIEMLIKSGAIEGELATAWTEKLEDEKEVKEWRAEAEGWRRGRDVHARRDLRERPVRPRGGPGASPRVVRALCGRPQPTRDGVFWWLSTPWHRWS